MVLIVDDEVPLQELLQRALERDGYRVVVAGTAADGVAAFERESPDAILLDVMLPDRSGRDVCQEIRSRSTVPIIMLTALDDEVDKVVGLELGADDYITKPFGLSELRSRVRAVLRRASMGAPAAGEPDVAVLDEAGVRLDRGRRAVAVDGADVDLTYVEFEILTTLMESPGRVYSRAQLLDAVWGSSDFREPRTVDVHVRHLREKIEADPASPVRIHTVRGVGYRFEG
ncbi:MAG: response regulator transcription factor [Actinobacteria bacterium]|nr:response regulator transcription factor [Actinomycetota bacterium]